MGKQRHLHQNFVTVANYINCNIFVKIWHDFGVTNTLLTTKLYQLLIFNGTWHTKLNTPVRVALLQKWFNIISNMGVLITYHVQICPKWFLAVMTPRYITFILTKNWFVQTWAGMGNWYYMSCWVNVWNFRKKNFFFQNFKTYFCFKNDLSVIFGFLPPKLIKYQFSQKFSEPNSKYEQKCLTINFQDRHQ